MSKNNLKATIIADTSGFKAGMKEAKNALKSFDKEASSALSNIVGLLGGTTDALDDLIDNVTKCHALFSELFRDADGGLSGMRKALAGVASGLAGLGITAVVTAFKKLNQEADKFKETMSGAQLQAGAQALRDTYREILSGSTGGEGSGGVGEWWARTMENIRTNASITWTNATTGATEEQIKDALNAAGQMADLAGKRVGIEKEISQNLSSQVLMEARINELSEKANDSSLSQKERADAKAQAVNLTNIYYDRQIALQNRLAGVLGEINAAMPTQESMVAQFEASKKITDLEKKRKNDLAEIEGKSNSIAGSAKDTKDAVEETVSLLEQVVGSKLADELNQAIGNEIIRNDVGVQRIYDEGFINMMKNVPGLPDQAKALKVPGLIVPQFDTQEWIDVSQEIAGIVENALTTIGDSIGQLMGDLATGGDAWGNFTNNAISAFGDMAMSVGKIAISTGVAALGIQTALKSLNPYVAIAAGTALVALGAAVKAGMSNIASGGGYSSSVASSSYASGTYGATGFGREMNVKVTGTLTANGSQLVAVLNNENDRKNYTT